MGDRIYEDRIQHVRAFEDFAASYIAGKQGQRAPLVASVVQVAEETRYLKPSVELQTVQSMLKDHNIARRSMQNQVHVPALRIKKTVYYTGYLLRSQASADVINSLELGKHVVGEGMKLLANSVLITPRPASGAVLKKTGGLGRKVEFEIVKVGQWDNRVWAAEVRPVDPTVRIYTGMLPPGFEGEVLRNKTITNR